jgi:glycosyltransferase involved in cell wall biosynthesis
LKIFFVSVFYLPQAVGGIELYIHNLAKGLLAKGHDIKIVVPAYEDYDINMNDYELDGLPVIRYNGFGAEGNKLQMVGIEPNEGLNNFKQLLAREKPDVVHFSQLTNSSGVSLDHILAAKQSGAKAVYTNHLAEFICRRGNLKYKGITDCDGQITVQKCTACMLHNKGMNALTVSVAMLADSIATKIVGKKNYVRQLKPVTFPGFATRWHINKIESVVNMSDAFVSIAEWSSSLMKKNNWFKNNCVTIKTGLFKINTERKSIAAYDGNRPLKIIYMGRIVPVKGLEVLVRAVTKMDKTKIELHIYGPKGHGVYSTHVDYCRSLAAGFDNIIFHSAVDNSEVVKLISEHDLFCLPSTGIEMAPLVIQEAMAAGVPVIGSDLPAIKEWVTDKLNGFIFPVNDDQILKEKLQQVISNPSLLASLQNNIQTPVSFDEVINNYDKLYQSLFSNN